MDWIATSITSRFRHAGNPGAASLGLLAQGLFENGNQRAGWGWIYLQALTSISSSGMSYVTKEKARH